jgi:hypothetical protein
MSTEMFTTTCLIHTYDCTGSSATFDRTRIAQLAYFSRHGATHVYHDRTGLLFHRHSSSYVHIFCLQNFSTCNLQLLDDALANPSHAQFINADKLAEYRGFGGVSEMLGHLQGVILRCRCALRMTCL